MTVMDFLEFSVDGGLQKVTLFDVEIQKDFFLGTVDEAIDKYGELEICSFDIIGKKDGGSDKLVLNVER